MDVEKFKEELKILQDTYKELYEQARKGCMDDKITLPIDHVNIFIDVKRYIAVTVALDDVRNLVTKYLL